MLGDLAKLFKLAGFEEQVGFGKDVVVADVSEAFTYKAKAGDVSLLKSASQLFEDDMYDFIG